MKTTLEIPDDLMLLLKLRAVERDQTLSSTVAQLLEAGIAAASDDKPSVRAPRRVRLKPRRPLTIVDIKAAIRRN